MPLFTSSFSFITKRRYWQFYAAGVVLLVISGWLWWTQIHLGPERVFWGMVSNSLSTKGVTIETNQSADGSSIKQVVQMELGNTYKAHSLTTLKQQGTEVKTEIIGTRDTDYTRYRSINTDQKNAQGKELDTSKVINVWSKSDGTQQTAQTSSSYQLLAQAVLGIGLPVGSTPVPIGEVSSGEREDLLRQIKSENVYETNFKDAKKERKDGKLLYTYETKIQTILYVKLMKAFAKDIGMTELDGVDPNSYQSSEPLSVKLTVDAHSRQLVGVDTGQGYKQTYAGYGLPLKVSIPKNPISGAELQQRLSQL